jgi:hypothetical protein
LQFKDVIILCYSRQNIVRINGKVPPLLIWNILKIIVDSSFPIVTTYVVNQSKSNWLLFDALQSAITVCLKFKEEIINPSAPINLIDDDSKIAFELFLFASNIKREVCSVLDYFLSFLRKFEERKAHNMFMMIQKLFFSIFFCWVRGRCKYCG